MSAPRRRRSQHISLGVVGAIALAFTGCEDNDTAYCVDGTDEVVENRYCEDDDNSYFWYFGGAHISGGKIRKGVKLAGGDRVLASNKAALAQRGGFGTRAKGGGVGRAVTGGS